MSFFLWLYPEPRPVVLQRLKNGVLGEKSKIDEERDPRLGNLVGRTDMVSLIAHHPTQSHQQPGVASREIKITEEDAMLFTCLLVGYFDFE